MRTRVYMSALAGTALALAAPLVIPGSAKAATVDASCTQTGIAAANLSSLLGSGSDLVPGATCTMQGTSQASAVAKLKVSSTAGLVSGQMKLRMTSPFFGLQEKTITCGPALNTCEATTPVPVFFFSTSSLATCSVTGVVAVLTSVSCSVEAP